MLPTSTPTTTTLVINNIDSHTLNSKLVLSNHSSSSPRRMHHDHTNKNPQLQSEWINRSNAEIENNKNNMNNIKQRKKQSIPLPAPFLSFQVKKADCALYVGNIPLDERTPCKVCYKTKFDDLSNSTENESVTKKHSSNEGNCACARELKSFLRDRINAAFRIPVEDIGIRTCRLFSVVTNVYSNAAPDPNAPQESCNADTPANSLRHHSGRRVHRAACVEFEDPKIAEHTLALKFTSFHFEGQPHNRSSLRIRRWTTEPPQSSPPPPPNASSPRTWSPKQRQPPTPPRSKSVSPKVVSSKRQQLQSPPPPRSKSMSPSVSNGRKQQQRRKQVSLTTTIGEKSISHETLPDIDVTLDDTSSLSDKESLGSEERSSPACSSCIVHVGNIPTNATSESIREFFTDRMNKAFHGVTPPEIIRIGMRRHCPTNSKCIDTANPLRIDACVEFQDAGVASRATLLKNRRWHIKKQKECENEMTGGSQNYTEGVHDKEDVVDGTSHINNDDEHLGGKKRKSSTPVLEIEIWNPAKYDARDFFPTSKNEPSTDVIGTKEDTDDCSEAQLGEDGVETARNESSKISPTLSKKDLLIEAKDSGFLICTNPNKTPKCDHLFTIELPNGEEGSEFKIARMCHGYAFRGKVCRTDKKKGGNFKRRDSTCPFAHIDSFDELKDPHDVLSLLYYVENNDEVEFTPGTGCSPQEYLQRQIQCHPITEEKNVSDNKTETISHLEQPTEEALRELRSTLSAVREELITTKKQLHHSELARLSLLEQHTIHNEAEHSTTTRTSQDEKDITIRLLQDELARLRKDFEETNHKWKISALAAENTKRDYALLQDKYQQHLDREGKFHTSTELLQLEVIQLKGDLKQSRSDNQKLKHQQQQQEQKGSSPIGLSQNEDSWPELVQFDNFLERSIPTLMQMTDGNSDEELHLQLLSKVPQQHNLDQNSSSRLLDASAVDRMSSSRLLDIPELNRSPSSHIIDVPALKGSPSGHIPYQVIGDFNQLQPTGVATATARNETSPTSGEDSLRSEISYLLSSYGNQVSVMNGESMMITRFLKLPMSSYQARDIDMALVLTIPQGYPWQGIVKVNTDPRLTNHFGADYQYRKILSESISGLLNVCRWEAEACQGNQHVLMNIMKSAERWVQNDWKVIQKKNLVVADYDSSQDDSNSSSA